MAMGVRPVILQIVGYQNSGKTTLMCQLIEEATIHNLRVGTMKHHGHGGKPDSASLNKDSDKHYAAGAVASAVEGAGVLQLTAQLNQDDPEGLLAVLQAMPLDLILIEGYKHWPYPKVVMLKNQQDERLLEQVNHTIAVVSLEERPQMTSFPVFLRGDEEQLLLWLVSYIRRQQHA